MGWVFWRGCKEKGGMAMSSGSFQSFSFISRRIFDMSNRERESTSARRHTHTNRTTHCTTNQKENQETPPLSMPYGLSAETDPSYQIAQPFTTTSLLLWFQIKQQKESQKWRQKKQNKKTAKINETDKGRISNRWPQFSSWHNKKETSKRKTGRKEKIE